VHLSSISWGSVSAFVVVIFEGSEEGVALSETSHGLRELGIVFSLGHEFPGSPLLHDAEQFDLVMGLEDKFLNEAARDLLLDSSDGTVLINDLHSVASEFTG
jgi:hypothetical protein